MGLLYRHLLSLDLGPRVIFQRIASLFLLLVALTLPACAEEKLPQGTLIGTITWVYDGDTLKIEPHGTVRLIGIDSPEKDDSKRDAFLDRQDVSPEKQRHVHHMAKRFNITQTKGKLVALTLDDPPRDRYDRLMAYVYLPDGRLLNRVLIEQGLAVVYRRFAFRMKEDFLAAEEQARRDKVGMWAD